MAKMFPERLPEATLRERGKQAEVDVYRALASSLHDGYTVFYGVKWISKPEHGYTQDGEADFVVAHPDHGVMVLEVKGGEISFDASASRWSSRSANGETHPIKDPFQQAMVGKKMLLNKLKQHPALKGKHIPMSHGVVFPKALKNHFALAPDQPPEVIVDHDDLTRLPGAIERVFGYWKEKISEGAFGAAGMGAIEGVLGRSFQYRLPMAHALREDQRRMVELTEQQFMVLDLLSQQRRAAIHGGGGSGKTLLAMEKARRLANEGFRTLLTCYNRPLAESIKAALGAVENLTVANFHTLAYETAAGCGIPLADPAKPEILPKNFWEEQVPEAYLQALDSGFEKFDAIVVDEGQDFQEGWWIPLQFSLNDPDQGVFYVFQDDQQRIYRQGKLLEGVAPFPLNQNLRNTQVIHRLAQRFYAGGKSTARGPEGRPIEYVVPDNRTLLTSEIRRVIERLIQEEKVAPEDIAVLYARKQHREQIAPEHKIGRYPVTLSTETKPGHCVLETIHRFKGLERPVVVLAGLQGLRLPNDQSLIYVGITRAQGHLVIAEEKQVLAQLNLL
ncbi:MAG: NERD domain-containing protein [Deltaproteobacteria bacterium]|nr:NERD domain-containing protein [Deltaproteobacteria bacterium]